MSQYPIAYTPRELHEQLLAASAAIAALIKEDELEAAEDKKSELSALRREYAATLGI